MANFEEAIKRLIDLTRDFCKEEEKENIAIGISTSYHIIYKAELKGTLAFSDVLREKKVIAQNILNILPLIDPNLSAE